MYIGIAALKSILDEDRKIVNWFTVSSINENRSEIEFSYGDKFITNSSICELFNIAKFKNYNLPPANEVIYKFTAINQDNLIDITDEYILFNDDMKHENCFESSNILMETYEISLNCHHHDI